MDIESRLNLLASAEKFVVSKDNEGGYKVEFKYSGYDESMVAFYQDGGWHYYIEGVYNYGGDFVEIEMAQLEELKAFCEMLGGE